MVLTFESVDKILKCKHSSEISFSGTFLLYCFCDYSGVCGWNPLRTVYFIVNNKNFYFA